MTVRIVRKQFHHSKSIRPEKSAAWRMLASIKSKAIDFARKFPGITGSLAMHVLLFLLLIGDAFFHFLSPKLPATPPVIMLEMLPIAEKTNLPPQPQKPVKAPEKPKEKPEPPKPKPPAPPAKPKEKPKAPKLAAPPAKPKAKPKIQEKPAEKPKEKPPEIVKKKDPPKQDFGSVLKNLEALREETSQPKAQSSANDYDPSKPLSVSEIDAFRQHMRECWRVLPGAKDAAEMVVTVHFSLNRNAQVINAEIQDRGRYQRDSFFRASADAALRAVYECAPYDFLPTEKYQQWKENEFTFDPKDML